MIKLLHDIYSFYYLYTYLYSAISHDQHTDIVSNDDTTINIQYKELYRETYQATLRRK